MKRRLILIAFALAAFLSTINGMAALLKTAANLETAPAAVAELPPATSDQKTTTTGTGDLAQTDGKSWGG
jgi:hypothetical protein